MFVAIGEDKPVLDGDDPAGVLGHIVLMRDKDDSAPLFLIESLERRKDDFPCFGSIGGCGIRCRGRLP